MTSDTPEPPTRRRDGAAAPAPRRLPAPAPARRSFLRGMAGGVAGGVIAGGAAGAAAGYACRSAPADPTAAANAAAVTGRLPAVPFHGKYQAGILPGPSRATAVVSFDATAASRAELTDLFQTVTDRARFLTAGGTPPPVGIDGPPSDSGVLGPTVVPDGLTVTFGVGSTLFDDRYGLAALRPAHLTPMKPFPNDDLDPAQCGGDLILQLQRRQRRHRAARAAGHRQEHPRRHADQLADRRVHLPARPSGTVPRNLMGFMDGIANPPVTRPRRWTRWCGCIPAPPASRVDRRRQLLRGPADQDVRRVLGPGGHRASRRT